MDNPLQQYQTYLDLYDKITNLSTVASEIKLNATADNPEIVNELNILYLKIESLERFINELLPKISRECKKVSELI